MKFIKVPIEYQEEGRPGFDQDGRIEVQINIDQITLFNRTQDKSDITFVRLGCGVTLMVLMTYENFVKTIQSVDKMNRVVVK